MNHETLCCLGDAVDTRTPSLCLGAEIAMYYSKWGGAELTGEG